ncbi:MAG: type IV pilus modification PilV family protein [Hyphomicrobiales bacterium]
MILKPSAAIENGTSGGSPGYTLIEMLMAIAIFSIGILAVFSMQISAINGDAAARMRTEATIMASELAEEEMSLIYNNVVPEGPTKVGVYTWKIDVQNDSPMRSTKTINVTVCWRDNNAAPDSCTPAFGLKSVTLDVVRADI